MKITMKNKTLKSIKFGALVAGDVFRFAQGGSVLYMKVGDISKAGYESAYSDRIRYVAVRSGFGYSISSNNISVLRVKGYFQEENE